MNFVALDVETANSNIGSICQIGLVVFENGLIVEEKAWLINPEMRFSAFNIAIHGICSEDVKNEKTWAACHAEIQRCIENQIVVSHGHFDRIAIQSVCERYGYSGINCRWLDSIKVSRRTWKDVQRSGYGLAALAQKLQITFQHHDALEDARTAGKIMIRAIGETGIPIEKWLTYANKPLRKCFSCAAS